MLATIAPISESVPETSLHEDKIMRRIIDNLGLVHKVALQWTGNYASGLNSDTRDDLRKELVQAGVLGLHKAAERFDEGRGNQFSTYAIHWIRKYIREAANDFKDMYQGEAWSLDAPVGGSANDADSETTRIDMLADESAAAPYTRMERDSDVAFARRLLKFLPARERRVVELYLGIGGAKGMIFAEIAALEGVSAQCVHRVYKRALARLRHVPSVRRSRGKRVSRRSAGILAQNLSWQGASWGECRWNGQKIIASPHGWRRAAPRGAVAKEGKGGGEGGRARRGKCPWRDPVPNGRSARGRRSCDSRPSCGRCR